MTLFPFSFFFFFNDTATTEIYTLSLHDALPICEEHGVGQLPLGGMGVARQGLLELLGVTLHAPDAPGLQLRVALKVAPDRQERDALGFAVAVPRGVRRVTLVDPFRRVFKRGAVLDHALRLELDD